VRAEAVLRFHQALGGETVLHPDTEAAILDIVASGGGADNYEAILARYRAPANPQEEIRYLYALGSFDDSELANRTFDLATQEVRTQNAPYLLGSMLANRITGPLTWRRLTAEWDAVIAKFPSNSLPRMLDGVRGLCTPRALANEVTAFINDHPLVAGGRTVEQILERLGVNVAFGEREGARLAVELNDVP
jgi:puromycin-sensitive aminopeptidase